MNKENDCYEELKRIHQQIIDFEKEHEVKLNAITKESPIGAKMAKSSFYKLKEWAADDVEKYKADPDSFSIKCSVLNIGERMGNILSDVVNASTEFLTPSSIFWNLQSLNRRQADKIFESQVKYPFKLEDGENKKDLDKAYMFGYMKAVNELSEIIDRFSHYIDFTSDANEAAEAETEK